MTIPVEVLEAEVLSLPAPLRSRLLDKLIASLDKEAGWEEAWAAEAYRLEAEIAAGTVGWIPGDQALARLREELASAFAPQHRADGSWITAPRK